MHSKNVLMSFLVVASLALAGCTTEDDTTPTPTTPTDTTPTTPTETTPTTPTDTTPPPTTPASPEPDATTYELTVSDVPNAARVGESFNFTLAAEGDLDWTTEHVGAHYADNDTTSPAAAAMSTCDHGAGDVPGTFNVTCTIDEGGAWFVYGHLRVMLDDGSEVDYWADPFEVAVVEEYDLTTDLPEAVPATVGVGQDLEFTLTVDGNATLMSQHVGAHYGPNQTEEPTVSDFTGTCAHTEGTAPDTFDVTCTFDEAGTYYLRGHIRFGSGDSQVDLWSDEEYEILVTIV